MPYTFHQIIYRQLDTCSHSISHSIDEVSNISIKIDPMIAVLCIFNVSQVPNVPSCCSSKAMLRRGWPPIPDDKQKRRQWLTMSLPRETSLIFSTLHSSFSSILNPVRPTSVDPEVVFVGNFAPVDELEPTECPVVEGELPLALDGGVYIRNGPNPQHKPLGPLHLSEADGMLHSLRFSNGRAIYCSRYVKTYKYMLEREVRSPFFPNFLSGFFGFNDVSRFLCFLGRVMIGHVDLLKGFGVANTSLAFFANKLFALYEADLPYDITLTQNGDMETLGRWEFDTKLFSNMTAHPKLDKDTNETFAFRYCPTFPHLVFFRFNEKGVKQSEVPILSVKQPSFIHDFAVTKRFAIFQETQLVAVPLKVMLGRGTLVDYDASKTPRIGIMPRYARSDLEMQWFDAPGLNVLHIFNAWEDGEDEIVLIASNLKSADRIYDKRINVSMEKIMVNMKTGKVSANILSPRNLEFGSINGSYAGKKNRYAYIAVLEEVPRLAGVVKLDLEAGCEVGRRIYGDGCFGGEPMFVKKSTEDATAPDDYEDDGYVLTYMHNEKTGESSFVVMDARLPDLPIVAAVKLPRRVPYGFHGLFLSKEDLSQMSQSM